MTASYASFVYPVINGKVYAVQRATEPFEGMRWPAWWKAEAHGTITEIPNYKMTLQWTQELTLADKIRKWGGFEYCKTTAARELAEEVFSINQSDINKWIQENIYSFHKIWFGDIGDLAYCSVFVAELIADTFILKERELRAIKPISDILPQDFFPIAKISLYSLLQDIERRGGIHPRIEVFNSIQDQLPCYQKQEIKELMRQTASPSTNLHLLGF